jgi:hypothetical protein
MIDDIHFIGGIVLPSGGFISQLTDASPENNQQLLTGMAAGHPEPLFQSIMGAKPACNFTTPQLKTLLDATGVFGLDTSAGNTDFLFRRAKNLGTRQPSSGTGSTVNHKRIRAASGLMYPTQIVAEYQREVMAHVRYKPVSSDGETAPWTPAGNLTLANTPTAQEFFTLGAIYIGGQYIRGAKRLSINLSPKMIEEGAEDNLYDTYCAVEEIQPVVEIEGLSWDQWTAIGLTGLALTDVEIYFRKKLNYGTHVPKATAQHISFTATKALSIVPFSRGGGNTPVRTGVRIAIAAPDGQDSSHCFAINTATASL